MNVAVIGGGTARRLAANRATLGGLVPAGRVHGVALGAFWDGLLVGALVGTPPGGYPLPPPSLARRLRIAAVQGLRVASRWRRVFETLHAAHPVHPHWYLGILGVDPAWQGRGAGRALLSAFLARADADGVAVYLETDREENVRFYGGAGFRVVGEMRVLGAPVWRVERPRGL